MTPRQNISSLAEIIILLHRVPNAVFELSESTSVGDCCSWRSMVWHTFCAWLSFWIQTRVAIWRVIKNLARHHHRSRSSGRRHRGCALTITDLRRPRRHHVGTSLSITAVHCTVAVNWCMARNDWERQVDVWNATWLISIATCEFISVDWTTPNDRTE